MEESDLVEQISMSLKIYQMKEVFQGWYWADDELTVTEGRTRWSFAVSSLIYLSMLLTA